MPDDGKLIYTALAADIMDQMGHRDQTMDSGIRPALPESGFAGPAVTLNAVADSRPSDDPYGKIFEAYELMSPGEVVPGQLTAGITNPAPAPPPAEE